MLLGRSGPDASLPGRPPPWRARCCPEVALTRFSARTLYRPHVDVRHEPVELGPQANGLGALLERLGRRQLEAIANEAHPVAGVDRGLQRAERVLLLGFELAQPLVGVEGPPERDGELLAVGVPALGGQEKPGGVGVAAPDRPEQPPGPRHVFGTSSTGSSMNRPPVAERIRVSAASNSSSPLDAPFSSTASRTACTARRR